MNNFKIKVTIAIIWLIFTISLVVWWFVHAWAQIELNAPDNIRSMLKWEGFSLVIALLAGGIAIVYLIYKERKSYRTLNDFYLAFNHDLKNSMTSLQMQVGAIKDKYQGEENSLISRLERDSRRLQMKLENSLELSKLNISSLYLEDILLSDIISRVRFHEPDIEVSLEHDHIIHGDRRTLEIIFQNIFNNAVKHGSATRISIETDDSEHDKITIIISDNGSGFKGSRKQLAQLSTLTNINNNAGIGLYLVDKLIQKMRGEVNFPSSDNSKGFIVKLTFLKAQKT